MDLSECTRCKLLQLIFALSSDKLFADVNLTLSNLALSTNIENDQKGKSEGKNQQLHRSFDDNKPTKPQN